METNSEIAELVKSELSLSKRQLLAELKDDLLSWAKKRFWFVSILSVFGLAAIINTLLQITIGTATKDANKAAIEATLTAQRAASAIVNIDASIAEAGVATDSANEKAQLATESARQAQVVAERASTEAERAAAATTEANDALDTLQSDRIKNISDKLIGLEGKIDELDDLANAFGQLNQTITPRISEIDAGVDENSERIQFAADRLDRMGGLLDTNEERIASSTDLAAQVSDRSELMRATLDELETAISTTEEKASAILELIEPGDVVRRFIEREALRELESYNEEMYLSNRVRSSTMRGVIRRGIHCSLPEMVGSEELNQLLAAAGYSKFQVNMYSDFEDLAEAFSLGECNFLINSGSVAKRVVSRLSDSVVGRRLRSRLATIDGSSLD